MDPFVFDKGETSQPQGHAPAADAETERPIPVSGDREGLEGRIVSALRTVYDPEIPVDIYELGLIYRIDIDEDGKRANICMTLTAPGCPVAGEMPRHVEHSVRGMVPELESVTVELVWDPPWDKDMMSEAARLELGFF